MYPDAAEGIITLTPPRGRGLTVEQRLDAVDARLDALCEGLEQLQNDLNQLKETP